MAHRDVAPGATIASVLRLAPPAATGFALDTIVGQRRTPDALARFGLTVPPQRLLTTITLVLISLVLLNALISAAGRQLDARASHGLQARLRRRVFDHLLGLPIHRIRAHRAGCLAGFLRDRRRFSGRRPVFDDGLQPVAFPGRARRD